MNVLVTGGAGYVGSHTVAELAGNHNVVVYDNLSTGHRESVNNAIFEYGDINDTSKLNEVFNRYAIKAVIHFAASSLVGESASKPAVYYNNNVAGTLKLLDTMLKNKVNKIVFSSSAAVYGDVKIVPITENCALKPVNVYGISKLMVEQFLKSYDYAYGLKYTVLRYFNAAGAHESGEIGEDHQPESHLIPIILQVALGRREKLQIFGNDYSTPDGTCIRDYIHVTDLAQAHLLALQNLFDGMPSNIYNLGNGKGFSVKEIIDIAERVSGQKIAYEVTERRGGDPAILVASYEKIKKELGWQPVRTIENIIASAWEWHRRHPEGYKAKNTMPGKTLPEIRLTNREQGYEQKA